MARKKGKKGVKALHYEDSSVSEDDDEGLSENDSDDEG